MADLSLNINLHPNLVSPRPRRVSCRRPAAVDANIGIFGIRKVFNVLLGFCLWLGAVETR